ncbi:acetate--CoA ligase family protein [Marmoricola sp. URHB0036]|uniref:acetate--CoA ligase family protein n=1 Tax=Marmoricola sp. URHB0036 TaxID=1298863 RepID=UPI00040BD00E|nr:acetate--CoA ligase family protein [Marmoricola sp. URHB0036]
MTRQGSPGSASDAALTALFEPRSIAVVGASSDPAKWGHILSKRALASSSGRPVVLVNRGGIDVLGQPTYASLAQARDGLGQPVDLVVLCVPATAFVDTVGQAVAAGARAVVAITAGLAELGAEGALAEAEAVAVARAGGAVLVGPNCLGIADTAAGLQLSHAVLPAGEVAVLSQSGNLVLDLAALLAERGLGISRFVSLGNQADLTVVDLMRACVDHEGTRAVAIYAEDVIDGRAFVSAARALVEAGKPVVLLSPGRSDAAVRSAVSHTGSMTSPSQVVDAACAAGGVRRVDHVTHLADLLAGLLGPRRMSGRRVAVLTDGGGHGAVAADALTAVGLETPLLEDATRARLRDVLWASSTVTNPVDLAGAGDRDPMNYARAVEALLPGEDVDGVLLTGWFGGYSTEPGGVHDVEIAAAHAIATAAAAQDKPVVVHTIFPTSPTSAVLREAGIPVHRDVDRACAVLAGLEEHPLASYDEEPSVALPVRDPSYDVARELFASAGIAFPAACTVRSRDELPSATTTTGFPLVLKALGQVHKSDGGGVVLGLGDEQSTLAAYDDLVERLAPPAVSVEAMADLGAGVELIVGSVRDRTFGPVLMVGLGGVHAEVLADTACALAPVGVDQARQLVLSLRGAPLLTGFRGSEPVDLDALAAAVSAFSRVAAAHPELSELEINPLLTGPSGTLALDARVVLAQASTSRR